MSLKTLDNALELLEYFKKKPSWGVRELAKEMGFSLTVTHRLLTTFKNHSYLILDPESQRYELGLKFLEFGFLTMDTLKFRDLVFPNMEKLARETDETIFLTWLDGYEGLSIAIAESSQSIKFAFEVGTRKPLHSAASNRIILAYLPEDEQNQILSGKLERLTNQTITDPEGIKKGLLEMREQGWGCTLGETTTDVVGIAVPLFDYTNRIIGSLTVAGPVYRIPKEKETEILALLLKEKEIIQNNINKLGLTYSQIKKCL
ncbi:IclR family transcriptional regulator [Neobacillus drentensis]|uniref:IclR family transcriptional regulator n=1 Tax=Neobacillus drentensis TaxID=220684 RepID=UPI000824A34E|nr:IclR family transcriptional regulator [Neobacillus drentensis]